jgi:hypothetical protein
VGSCNILILILILHTGAAPMPPGLTAPQKAQAHMSLKERWHSLRERHVEPLLLLCHSRRHPPSNVPVRRHRAC